MRDGESAAPSSTGSSRRRDRDASVDWRAGLRNARRSIGLSQRQLSERAGVSIDAIRAWEAGRRNPLRAHLARVLEELDLDQLEHNRILEGAGFAADAHRSAPPPQRRVMRLPDAREEIVRYRWPAFVVNDLVEIVAVNDVARFLWGFDPDDATLSRAERHPMAHATHPRLTERVVNWEEAAAQQIAAWKGHYRRLERLDAPSPAFAPVVERILAGDPVYVRRFTQLWEAIPAGKPDAYRFAYDIVWREPGYGTMRFQCFAWVVNEIDGIDIDDWIPVDVSSWEVLERIRADLPRIG